MISVIIPVYNVEQYLSKCIDSLLSQTIQDFEVILIDDGCIDRSPVICNKYSKLDARVKVVKQSNSGVSKARNNGIEIAKGDWITFIDSDDWVENSFLEDFQLESTPSDISVQGLKYIKYPELKEFNTIEFFEERLDLNTEGYKVAKNNLLSYGTVCCKAYRKEIIDKFHIRFDETITYHEDHLFFFQYLSHICSVELHKAKGYNYRITYSGTSLSSKKYPWEKLNVSSENMLHHLLELAFFESLPIEYKRKMTTYSLSPKVQACYSLYTQDLSMSDRLDVLKVLFSDKKTIMKFYYPTDRRNRILKRMLNIGLSVTDIYLLLFEFVRTTFKR